MKRPLLHKLRDRLARHTPVQYPPQRYTQPSLQEPQTTEPGWNFWQHLYYKSLAVAGLFFLIPILAAICYILYLVATTPSLPPIQH